MAEGISPREIIASYEQKFIDALQDSLTKHDKVSGGGLFQSVKAITKVYGQKIILEIRMDDYWKFVDKGVDGTFIKHGSEYSFKKGNIKQDATKKFIINNGIKQFKKPDGTIIFDVNKKSKQPLEKRYKTLGWLLGRTIAKRGIKPTHFATDVMEGSLIDEFRRDIIKAVGRNIKIEIDKEIKN